MKRILKITKFFSFFVLASYLVVWALYQTNFIHWGLKKFCVRSSLGCYIEEFTHSIMTPFNFYKVVNKSNLKKSDYIDLRLSLEELEYIPEKIKYFLDIGFIEDSSNEWRNASVIVDNSYEKVKYKFHGTSTSNLKESMPGLWRFLKYLNFEQDIDLSKADFSLKIKHGKNSEYKDKKRRYNIIAVRNKSTDSIYAMAINAIAKRFGLLAKETEYKVLRINGVAIGTVILEEDHKKEWFEREHGITNYSLIKSIDDWDTRDPGHLSDLDLTIEYKEIKTAGKQNFVALNKLEKLFNAINLKDINKIKSLIDIEDTAKYLALFSLVNNNHSITGDNLKYVYNFSTGKFRFIFRAEDGPRLMKGPMSNFNNELFNSVFTNNQNVKTHEIFKLLLQDEEFRLFRDTSLLKILENWDNNIIKVIDEIVEKNKNVILQSHDRGRALLHSAESLKEVMNFHKSLALNYLNYNKVYITRKMQTNSFSIFNDSFSPILLESLEIKNNESKIVNKEVNKKFPALKLNTSLVPVSKRLNFQVDLENNDTITNFNITNLLTRKKINSKNIYLNKSVSEKEYIGDVNTMKINNLEKEIIFDETTNIIKKTLITPIGYKVIIKPGTKILLDADVSILIRGPLIAEGNENNKIVITSLNKEKPFGTIAVLPPNKKDLVKIKYFTVDGGNEAVVDSTYFSGQMSIHGADVFIENSSFINSKSDDGINIKYSTVNIKNSYFANNIGDQIDLDFCDGKFENNKLVFEDYLNKAELETDGLDISGSQIIIDNNLFFNFSDKGISVGEKSYPLIKNNNLESNNMAIAVKDGSIAKVEQNTFINNKKDLSIYAKKKFYKYPKVIFSGNKKNINVSIMEGDIIYK